MAKRLTNAQLAEQLSAALTKVEQLTSECNALTAECDQLRRNVQRMRHHTPVRPQPLTPFREACAKARELAMRTGNSVKVGA